MSLEKNRAIYSLTEEYIRTKMLSDCGLPDTMLNPYLYPNHKIEDFDSLNMIYEHLLCHAKNVGQGGNSIKEVFGDGYALEGTPDYVKWQCLRELLHLFDPKWVTTNLTIYQLFAQLENRLKKGAEPSVFVYRFCRSITTGASYLSKFSSAEEFKHEFANVDAKTAIAKLESVQGFGKALPLDFLKEMGFDQLVKPDVHTIAVCASLGLVSPQSKTIEADTVASMQEIAKAAGKTPYSLDRMFWLIGSGKFFDRSDVKVEFTTAARKIWNNKAKAVHRKNAFITYLTNILND